MVVATNEDAPPLPNAVQLVPPQAPLPPFPAGVGAGAQQLRFQLRLQLIAVEAQRYLNHLREDCQHAANSFGIFLLEPRTCTVMRAAPQLADHVVNELVVCLGAGNYVAAIVLEKLAERPIYHRAVNDNGGVEALIEQVRARLGANWRGTPSVKYVLHALQRWLHQTLALDAPHVKRVFAPRATLEVFVGLLVHARCSDWVRACAAEGLAVGLHDHPDLADPCWRRCFPPLTRLALAGIKRQRRSAVRALVVLASCEAHRAAMAEAGGPTLMVAVADFHESRAQQRCDSCAIEFSDGRSYAICGGCRSVLYCSAACQKEHWQTAHRAVCRQRTAEWCTRLHVLVGRSWPCTKEKVVKLLREGADLNACMSPNGPTPLSLATEAALALRAGKGTAAHYVLQAAAPWSCATHQFFPAAARERAWELVVVGYQLSRRAPFEEYSQAIMDVWLNCIMAYAIERDTSSSLSSLDAAVNSSKAATSSEDRSGGAAAPRGSEDLGGPLGEEPSVLGASLGVGHELPEGGCHGGC